MLAALCLHDLTSPGTRRPRPYHLKKNYTGYHQEANQVFILWIPKNPDIWLENLVSQENCKNAGHRKSRVCGSDVDPDRDAFGSVDPIREKQS